jgi:hypothetical protein
MMRKLAWTTTVVRRSGSFAAGGVTVMLERRQNGEVAVIPAALQTSVTRDVTLGTSGAVTTASLQPSRAAEVNTLTAIQARPNSVIPNKTSRSSGRTRANSITD